MKAGAGTAVAVAGRAAERPIRTPSSIPAALRILLLPNRSVSQSARRVRPDRRFPGSPSGEDHRCVQFPCHLRRRWHGGPGGGIAVSQGYIPTDKGIAGRRPPRTVADLRREGCNPELRSACFARTGTVRASGCGRPFLDCRTVLAPRSTAARGGVRLTPPGTGPLARRVSQRCRRGGHADPRDRRVAASA